MPDLIAQGGRPEQRWRRGVPPRQTIVIGRGGTWAVAWDQQVSRQHAEICWKHGRLQVRRLKEATNPVFLHGAANDQFFIKPGEHFVIGNTMFTLADEKVRFAAGEASPVTEQSYSPQFLQNLRFRNADQRIDVLSRLPEIISGATDDTELFVRVVNVLMSGVPRASAVAIVVAEPADDAQANVRVLHWDHRALADDEFRPSRRLILQAVATGESVVHVWGEAPGESGAQFTINDQNDWAFCTPLSGAACRGWAIYVAGKVHAVAGATDETAASTDLEEDLRDDLKFTELAAGTLSSLRQLRQLQRNQASLRQFLSPVVLAAVGDADWDEVLAPRESDVTVLFCDLRGFSREAEKHADDLWSLLKRVSRALGVATHHILDQSGVVGDFHGDAVMGFWGWPLVQPDAAARAALAALGIRSEFEAAGQRDGHALSDFRIGVGIATGRAVAGKIGTTDQVTVTVFGPVVNLAARLEGMTKYLQAPILIDQPTAAAIRNLLPATVARVRRLARVRPYGLQSALDVSELLPSAAEFPALDEAHLANFQRAVDAIFGYGGAVDWPSALQLLQQVSGEDLARNFLAQYMAAHGDGPPADWDRVITLERK